VGDALKKLIPNFIVLAFLILLLLVRQPANSDTPNYWFFLTHHMVLSAPLIIISIVAGFFIRNYLFTLAGASFILAIYLMAFLTERNGIDFNQFFFAMYTIFIGCSVVANIFRHLKDWVFYQ